LGFLLEVWFCSTAKVPLFRYQIAKFQLANSVGVSQIGPLVSPTTEVLLQKSTELGRPKTRDTFSVYEKIPHQALKW
jgi:hypothetical protein